MGVVTVGGMLFALIDQVPRNRAPRAWTSAPVGILCGNGVHPMPEVRSREGMFGNVFQKCSTASPRQS